MASRKKRVTLTVSVPLLEQLLRLSEDMHITGAILNPDAGVVLFIVRAPNAPNNAFAMVPEYYNNGRPDPISLTAVEWLLPDGRTARTELGPPAKDAA
jgi:hypothetical protein